MKKQQNARKIKDWANYYASIGFTVLPVQKANIGDPKTGKNPITKGWNEAQKCRMLAEIKENCNIGIRLEGLVVLDVDDPRQAEMLLNGIEMPKTAICYKNNVNIVDVENFREKGHFYFRVPVSYLFDISGVKKITFDTGVLDEKGNSVIKTAYELRTGSGAQCVTAPSTHYTGAKYVWHNVDMLKNLPELPEDLYKRTLSLAGDKPNDKPNNGNGSAHNITKIGSDLDAITVDVLAETSGACSSYDDFVTLALAFKSAGFQYEQVDKVFQNSAGYDPKNNAKIYNAMKPNGKVTMRTAYAIAERLNPSLLKQKTTKKEEPAKCKKCGEDIFFFENKIGKKSGKMIPCDRDGNGHKCKNEAVGGIKTLADIGNYYVTQGGVFAKQINVNGNIVKDFLLIPQPVVVSALQCDINTGAVSAELTWGKKRKFFAADDLLFSKKHDKLAAEGILVTSNHGKHIVSYFQDAIKNLEEKEKPVSTKNGWLDKEKFVLGNRIVSKSKIEAIEYKGYSYQCETEGSIEKWQEIIADFANDYQIMLRIGASAISPFLKRLKCQNFTFHSWGGAGRCKTTSSLLAASLWGRPSLLKEDWKSSQAGKNLVFEEAGGLPVFFEESHKAKPEDVVQCVYDFGNQKMAAKGEIVDGKIKRRKSPEMLGIIMSTGENEISGLTPDGGAAARLLEQHKSKTEKKGYAELVERRMEQLEDNFGHLGEKIIQYFLSNEDEVKKLFDYWKGNLREKATAGIQYRQIPYFAACIVGCLMLGDLGVKMASGNTLAECCSSAMQNKPQSLAEKAQEYLYSVYSVNRKKFAQKGKKIVHEHGETEQDTETITQEELGLFEEKEKHLILHFYPSAFDKFIKDGGFSGRSAVCSALKEENLLECKDGRLTGYVKHLGSLRNVISVVIKNKGE